MEGKEDVKPSYEEIINMAIRHLNMLCEEKGEYIAVKQMRKHIAWYIKGMRNSNRVKNEINRLNSRKEVEITLKAYLEQLKSYNGD